MQCFLQQQSGLGNICADNVLYRSRRQFDDPRDIGESGRERERGLSENCRQDEFLLCCLRKFKLGFVNLICLDSNRLKSILGSFAMLVSSSF